MNKRSLRIPTGLLIAVAIAGSMLVVNDIDVLLETGDWAPLRSDLRAGLIIAATTALAWIVIGVGAQFLGRADTDEQPGYAKGYADGLSRKPMAGSSATVVQMRRTTD